MLFIEHIYLKGIIMNVNKIKSGIEVSAQKKASLYLRFSDPKQIGGTSIATQEQSCRASCINEGYEVVLVEKNEATSAGNEKQTHRVAHLLEFCKENRGKFDILMVYKLDRFARNQEEHHYLRGELTRLGIQLRSASEKIGETGAEKFMEGVLAAAAQYDNDIKRERVKLGLWRKVEEGLWPWQPPTGYVSVRVRDEKVQPHVPDENLSNVIIAIFTDFSTGTINQAELSKRYKERELKDYKGRVVAFSPTTINNILCNVYYAGKLKHEDGRLIDGKHKPLISYSLFLKCQDILQGRTRQGGMPKQYNHPDFPLRQYVKCAECHKGLTAQFSTSQHSGKYPHYFCHNPSCGQFNKTFRGLELKNAFSAYMAHIKPTQEFMEHFKIRFLSRYKLKERELKGDYLRIMEEIQAFDGELRWIIEQGKKGILQGETLATQIRETESNISRAKMRLRETHGEEIDVNLLLAYADSFVQTLEIVWLDAPSEYKKRLQKFVMPGGVCVASKWRELYLFKPRNRPILRTN